MSRYMIIILAVTFLFVSVSGLSPEVQQLCDDYWQWRLEDMPEFATFVGIHDYDDRLDDVSVGGQQLRVQNCTVFLERANSLEASGLTDDADIVNIQVLKYELETFINGFNLRGFYLPLNYREGLNVDMELQFGWMLREDYADYEKMLSRMSFLPTRVDQTIDVMTRGMSDGITYNNYSMKDMDESLGRFNVSDPTQSPFYVYFESDFPSNFTAQQIADLQTEAKTIIDEEVTPAYARLLSFVINDYVTRPDIAVTSMSNGPQYYDELIWFHTSTNLTAQQIYDIGLQEVDRIEAEMLKIVVEMGYDNMTTQQFSDMIRSDPNNYYNTGDELFAAMENISYDQIPPHIPEIIMDIPESELTLVNAPNPAAPVAFYLGPSYDGSRPGVFYVNTYDPSLSPKYNLMTLSLHEGNPGHHLQASHNVENPDTPFFRRVTEDRNYGISPSRFPLYTYYSEGWGLYAESLGFDMNLFDDPLDRYGHYSEEIFRAGRLVVDTGMHALGWSRQEAIDYMFQHTASSLGNIENEIDRYITWPGQALAYKMGELKFQEMKSDAKTDLGQNFDLRKFHDVVLDSIGPMTVVEAEVDNWVESTLP